MPPEEINWAIAVNVNILKSIILTRMLHSTCKILLEGKNGENYRELLDVLHVFLSEPQKQEKK